MRVFKCGLITLALAAMALSGVETAEAQRVGERVLAHKNGRYFAGRVISMSRTQLRVRLDTGERRRYSTPTSRVRTYWKRGHSVFCRGRRLVAGRLASSSTGSTLRVLVNRRVRVFRTTSCYTRSLTARFGSRTASARTTRRRTTTTRRPTTTTRRPTTTTRRPTTTTRRPTTTTRRSSRLSGLAAQLSGKHWQGEARNVGSNMVINTQWQIGFKAGDLGCQLGFALKRLIVTNRTTGPGGDVHRRHIGCAQVRGNTVRLISRETCVGKGFGMRNCRLVRIAPRDIGTTTIQLLSGGRLRVTNFLGQRVVLPFKGRI